MRLVEDGATWSLPADDRTCLAEAMLLAAALIAGDPRWLELQLLTRDGVSRVGLPEGGSFHAVIRDGEGELEGWVEIRSGGSARLHRSPIAGSETWPTVESDLARRPGRYRLEALAQRLADAAAPDSLFEQGREFVCNALRATAIDGVAPMRSSLRSLGREHVFEHSVAEARDKRAAILRSAKAVNKIVTRARERGEGDGRATSDACIGINLALAIAMSASPDEASAHWIRYMTAMCVFAGDSPFSVGPVLADAVRSGHVAQIADLAEKMLRLGEQHQEAALSQEEYDRLRFAKALFDGYPFMLAARRLAGSLVQLLPASNLDQHVRRILTVAEERCLRFADGLFWQWADLGQVCLQDEIAQVGRAQRAGNLREVRRIVISGEEQLRRPRGARALLLGDSTISGKSQ